MSEEIVERLEALAEHLRTDHDDVAAYRTIHDAIFVLGVRRRALEKIAEPAKPFQVDPLRHYPMYFGAGTEKPNPDRRWWQLWKPRTVANPNPGLWKTEEDGSWT